MAGKRKQPRMSRILLIPMGSSAIFGAPEEGDEALCVCAQGNVVESERERDGEGEPEPESEQERDRHGGGSRGRGRASEREKRE